MTYKRVLSYVTLKFPSTYRFRWGHELANSFLLLRLHSSFLQMIMNFSFRLINPSKSEIGVISKNILDRINKEVIQATKVNLWKSTNNTIEWFKAIPEKEKHAFITFDVCDFYPSISEDLLLNALDYSSKFTTITPQDRHIIIHAKKITPLPSKLSLDQEKHK